MSHISPVIWQFLVKWMTNFALFPPEASKIAPQVDALFFFMVLVSLIGLKMPPSGLGWIGLTPDGALISLLGIVNHLTHVEWRWIDGAMLGQQTSRSEAEFSPGPELTLSAAVAAYQARAASTDAAVRAFPSLTEPSVRDEETVVDMPRRLLTHCVTRDRHRA